MASGGYKEQLTNSCEGGIAALWWSVGKVALLPALMSQAQLAAQARESYRCRCGGPTMDKGATRQGPSPVNGCGECAMAQYMSVGSEECVGCTKHIDRTEQKSLLSWLNGSFQNLFF